MAVSETLASMCWFCSFATRASELRAFDQTAYAATPITSNSAASAAARSTDLRFACPKTKLAMPDLLHPIHYGSFGRLLVPMREEPPRCQLDAADECPDRGSQIT